MARLARGDRINASIRRTPLAIAYDPHAAEAVTAAVRRYGSRLSLTDWHRVYVASPPGDEVDRGGLTAHERAFTQAMYHDRRVYLWGTGSNEDGTRRRNPDREWALKVVWTQRRTRAGRLARVRVFPVGEASLYAEANADALNEAGG